MDDLKKVFKAALSLNDHTYEDAAKELGVSATMLHKFFGKQATSKPLKKKIIQYITDAGLVKSIKDLGLDPDQPAKRKVKTATA